MGDMEILLGTRLFAAQRMAALEWSSCGKRERLLTGNPGAAITRPQLASSGRSSHSNSFFGSHMKAIIGAMLFAVVVVPLTAFANNYPHKVSAAVDPASTALADDVVRTVDNEAKKLTIRHGPIPSLNMSAMTMVFHVRDPALLDQVKAGEKFTFGQRR